MRGRMLILVAVLVATAGTAMPQERVVTAVIDGLTIEVPGAIDSDAAAAKATAQGSTSMAKLNKLLTERLGKPKRDIQVSVRDKNVAAEFKTTDSTVAIAVYYKHMSGLNGGLLLVRARAADLGVTRGDNDARVIGVAAIALLPEAEQAKVLTAAQTIGVLSKKRLLELHGPKAMGPTKEEASKLTATAVVLARYWQAGKGKKLTDLLTAEAKELPDPADALKWCQDNPIKE